MRLSKKGEVFVGVYAIAAVIGIVIAGLVVNENEDLGKPVVRDVPIEQTSALVGTASPRI